MEKKIHAGCGLLRSNMRIQHSPGMTRGICVTTSPHCGQIQNRLLLCENTTQVLKRNESKHLFNTK